MINKTVLINQKWKCTDSGGLERASERRRKMKFHPFGKNERATPKERSSIAMFHQFEQRRLQLSRSHTKMLFINIRRYQFSIMITCHTARLAMSMPRARVISCLSRGINSSRRVKSGWVQILSAPDS